MAKALKINPCSIREIDNFIPVIKTLPLLVAKNTLMIFDVDSVLIMPDNNNDFRHPYRAQLWQELKNRLPKQQIEILHSKILSTIKWQLLESRIIKMFNCLKFQHIPTIALTAMGAGKYGAIKKMENFRINGLNSVDLSFAALTPLKGEQLVIVSDQIDLENKDHSSNGIPMLKNGIIFTAQIDKGIVLEYMLHKYNYYPKKIIFVDNHFVNVESLRQLCIKLKIEFNGFHYIATSFIPLPLINEHFEKLRFNTLEKEEVWLSYTQLENRQDLNRKYIVG